MLYVSLPYDLIHKESYCLPCNYLELANQAYYMRPVGSGKISGCFDDNPS